jgi:hypothetical protein
LSVDVEAFKCTQEPAFFGYVDNLHYILHCADGVLIVKEVLGEIRFICVLFVVPQVLLEPDSEWSASLSDIFHSAFGAS